MMVQKLFVSLPCPLEVQFRGIDDDREAVEQEEVVDDAEKFPELDDERRRHYIILFYASRVFDAFVLLFTKELSIGFALSLSLSVRGFG